MRLLFKHLLPGLGFLSTLTTAALAHAWDVKMPWRGDALPANSFMWTSGHGSSYNCPNGSGGGCGNDIQGVRWDATAGQWSFSKTGIVNSLKTSASFLRSDAVAWGMELYSPVDGEVIACWSGMPDDDENGDEPAACPITPGMDCNPKTECPLLCSTGGNFLQILTEDGFLVTLAHMQYHSAPFSVCPNDTGIVLDTVPKESCDLGMEGFQSGVINDTRVATPTFVKKGDLLGKVGLSGSTGVPHLHYGVYEYTEDDDGDGCQKGVPLEFAEGWTQPFTAGVAPTLTGWTSGEGTELNYDGTNYLLWGDPIGQKTDDDTHTAASFPSVAVTAQGGVFAYVNGGDLVARGFGYTAGEAFSYGTIETIADVNDIAVARIDEVSGHVVVAFSNDETKLELVPYFFNTSHNLIEGIGRAESTAGVGQVEATKAPTHDGVVVAIKNSLGGVSVVDYLTTLDNVDELTVTRKGSGATSTAISDLDVATMLTGRAIGESGTAFKGVVTVERRTSDSTVWLRSWKIDNAGVVALSHTAQVKSPANVAYTASDVDVTVTGASGTRQFVVVSLATSAGLRVQDWTVSTTGALVRVDEAQGGPVSKIDSARSGLRDAVVGVRITTGQMSLLSYQVDADGRLRRGGTVDGMNITDMHNLALGARNGSEDLVVLPLTPTTFVARLQHYLTNYAPGV